LRLGASRFGSTIRLGFVKEDGGKHRLARNDE
jgi:hypothetical protein